MVECADEDSIWKIAYSQTITVPRTGGIDAGKKRSKFDGILLNIGKSMCMLYNIVKFSSLGVKYLVSVKKKPEMLLGLCTND